MNFLEDGVSLELPMAAEKTVKAFVRLLVPAGQAKPAPPVGPALGQAGLNIMSFCKDFNARTADVKVSLRFDCFGLLPIACYIQCYWEIQHCGSCDVAGS